MKVKKIAALAVGAAMVGATIGFASATNVPQIPKSFFVKDDGTPNVKIVVGSSAAAMDVASAADIAVALGSLLYTTEQVEAQGDYVKVKAEFPPKTVFSEMIYAYNYTTMTEDHGLSDLTDWATKYTELPEDYWYNGAAYVSTYDEWKNRFKIEKEIESKDTINDNKKGKWNVDWYVTIKNVELDSKDPSEWEGTYPPKKADIVITPGNASVVIDYTLWNYTVEYTIPGSGPDSEWGIPVEDESGSTWYIGDADDEADATAYLPEGAELDDVIKDEFISGVGKGDTFTVFGQSFYVYEVGDNSFTVGYVDEKDPDWFKLHETRLISDRWQVTIQDIGIQQSSAIILVTDTQTDQQVTVLINSTAPAYIYYDDSGQLTWSHEPVAEAGLYLELKSTFVGIDNTIMASIYYVYDIKKYSSGDTITYNGKKWEMTINTKDGYIKNITLTNKDKLKGNPVDIVGTYDLIYNFEMKTKREKDANYDINGDGDKKDTLVVAYATISLKEKKGKVKEIELKPGETLKYVTSSGDVKEAKYNTVEEIHATFDQIVLKPATQPITVMDFEVDVNDPGSNLILVGGPVANSVTKYLVENNISKVDWYNSPGDVEYIPDAFGNYGAVIVAGATRNETRVAAEALMKYLAELVKE